MHVYEVHPRKDNRGVDLISDVLPFGRSGNGEPNASDYVIKNYRPPPPDGREGRLFPSEQTHSALGGRSLTMYCMSNMRSFAVDHQNTGRVGPFNAPTKTLLFMYQIPVC